MPVCRVGAEKFGLLEYRLSSLLLVVGRYPYLRRPRLTITRRSLARTDSLAVQSIVTFSRMAFGNSRAMMRRFSSPRTCAALSLTRERRKRRVRLLVGRVLRRAWRLLCPGGKQVTYERFEHKVSLNEKTCLDRPLLANRSPLPSVWKQRGNRLRRPPSENALRRHAGQVLQRTSLICHQNTQIDRCAASPWRRSRRI